MSPLIKIIRYSLKAPMDFMKVGLKHGCCIFLFTTLILRERKKILYYQVYLWNHRLSYLLGKMLKPLKLSCNAMPDTWKMILKIQLQAKCTFQVQLFKAGKYISSCVQHLTLRLELFCHDLWINFWKRERIWQVNIGPSLAGFCLTFE